jgi:hypothetical protein
MHSCSTLRFVVPDVFWYACNGSEAYKSFQDELSNGEPCQTDV